MNKYLVSAADPAQYLEGGFRHVQITGSIGEEFVLSILSTSNPLMPGNGELICGHDREGLPVAPVDQALWEQIRPLGNSPEMVLRDDDGNITNTVRAGVATSDLQYIDYAGFGQRQLGDGGNLYPDENPPFRIECRLLENVIYGWFPRWELRMESGAEVGRDPSVRNVRVFSSADCLYPSEFLYTTGAFIVGDSLWHTDGDGNPLTVWYTESNQFSAAADPVHFAIYWSETENGRFTVQNSESPIEALFWENNQTDVSTRGGSGGTWLDTGLTVQYVGARLIRISSTDLFQVGSKIKFNGVDTEYTVEIKHSSIDLILDSQPPATVVGDRVFLWT